MKGYPAHRQLHAAPRWVAARGVIAYPTQAVFGLGCDPGDAWAVERLLALKRRPVEKGLILERIRQLSDDWGMSTEEPFGEPVQGSEGFDPSPKEPKRSETEGTTA